MINLLILKQSRVETDKGRDLESITNKSSCAQTMNDFWHILRFKFIFGRSQDGDGEVRIDFSGYILQAYGRY